MTAPIFFIDEDVFPSVADQLVRFGFDAVSARSAGRLGEEDQSQLAWATSQSRTLVSFNVRDYARLHSQWIRQNLDHSGIVVSAQFEIGTIVKRLLRLAAAVSADDMRNRLEYLSNWN